MEVRKAIKRLVAIGTGAVMMGATVVGAMAAADLSNYPAPFIKDGEFDGLIVVGEDAASSDVVGAIDIAISLQYGAKTTTAVNAGGSAGTTTLSGDTAKFVGGADNLELQEQLGDVKETFSATDLNALASGLVSTDGGTSDFNQYLRFKKTSSGTVEFASGNIVYSENEDEEVGDFLYFEDGATIFEYELQFESGLESDVVTSSLEDLEDESLVILGKKFNIVQTSIDNDAADQDVKLTMLGGDVTDTLMEGETKTYTVNGQDYEVKLLIVSDTQVKCKFTVNGEVSKQLGEGDTDTLSDGSLLGIKDIMPNEGTEEEGGDIVEFYLGANKVEITDLNYTNSNWGGTIEVNDENIEDAELDLVMTDTTSSKVKLSSLKYRLKADSTQGDVFVKSGQGLREFLDEPQGMLNPDWDVQYAGLTEPASSTVEIRSNGDDSYYLYFTNLEGLDYRIPLADNSNNDEHGFKYGDNDDDLIFIEGALNADSQNNGYLISEDDYFVLGDAADEDGVYTHVLRYESIDTSNRELQFTDLAGGQKEVTYDASSSEGDLVVGGKTYTVYVNTTDPYNIMVDLDHSGTLEAGDEAKIAVPGGMIIDLGTYDQTAAGSDWDGVNMELAEESFEMTFTIGTDKFDETPGNDEVVTVNITESGTNQVDLSIKSGSNVSMETLDGQDVQRGMTTFGVLWEKTSTSSSNDAENLKAVVPETQKFGQVYVTFGDVDSTSTTAGGSGTIEVTEVERINVGAAKLDSEVTNVWAQNLIVVGGPCANDVAKEVMGVTEATCTEGFEEGKAMLKLFEKNGKVALLVAGFSAMDTRRAAHVVADYSKYEDDLTGTEVVVTGTTLSDITVSQPTPKEEVAEETTEETEETA